MRLLRVLFLAGAAAAIAYAVAPPAVRDEMMERLKDLSDVVVSGGLELTSQFGYELSRDQRAEQAEFRAQRLRYLR